MTKFDWEKVFKDPTKYKQENLIKKASSWYYCALSHFDVPKDKDNAPIDKLLFDLGNQFQFAVQESNFKKASTVYNKIKRRAKKLIK